MKISDIAASGFGHEITAAQVEEARAAGLMIQAFYRNADDEEATYYAASPKVVANYHRSGGTWSYDH